MIEVIRANAGAPLSDLSVPDVPTWWPEAYVATLRFRNGFVLCRGLLVRPVGRCSSFEDMHTWSTEWTQLYWPELQLDQFVFFGENVLGEPYGFDRTGRIVRFDPETAELDEEAPSFEAFISDLVSDPRSLAIGFLDAWEAEHSQLPLDECLVARMPFVLGGEYRMDNLVAKRRSEAMRIRAPIARAIRDVKDGEEIRIRIDP